jgi:hypothetical protein
MAEQGKLQPVNPISGFGIFMCCVGVIWTYISFMTVADNLNALQSKTKLTGFALWVPIWNIIMVWQAANALNDAIDEKRVNVAKVNPIVVLLLGPYYGFYAMFKAHNDLIAALPQ